MQSGKHRQTDYQTLRKTDKETGEPTLDFIHLDDIPKNPHYTISGKKTVVINKRYLFFLYSFYIKKMKFSKMFLLWDSGIH